MTKIVLISGATSGIGLACAHKFAENNCSLILTGRRNDRLEKIKTDFIKRYGVNVLTLNFDIRVLAEVEEAVKSIPEEWQSIDILINNAGLAAGASPVQDGLFSDWDQMIDTNIKGLLYVSRTVTPGMISRGKGHIINIGSSAGKEVYPKGNVYCGSKHAVLAITEGMRMDLNPFGIKVGAINPGLVETEFSKVRFKGDKIADSVYKGYKALQPEDVAEVIYFAISRPAHVNIADVLMFCTAQASSTILKKEI